MGDRVAVSGASESVQRAGSREWVGLAVLAPACVLYVMDLSVLHLAVPAISESLRPSSSQMLWIIDIYGFLVAGSLITMGSLGDRIGRRRLLLIGAAAFGAASLLAAFAPTAEWLIVARAVLGVAGATIAPSTLSLIRNMFHDPRQRSQAVAVWITAFSAGGAIGPVLGGLMLEKFWWGSVFLLNVPVMALLLLFGPRLLPEYRDPDAGPTDIPSAIAASTSVLAVIFAVKSLAQNGPSIAAGGAVALGIAVGAWFVRRQARLAHPLIDLALFRMPALRAALVLYGLTLLLVFGGFLFVPQYLQLVLGMSPLEAGLWAVPSALMFVIGANLGPWLLRWVTAINQIWCGLLLSVVGFGLLAAVPSGSGLWQLVLGECLFSLGTAPVFTHANDLIISRAPENRAGAASGISETAAELGGALGIALLGSLSVALYRDGVAPALTGLSSDDAELARSTLGGAVAVAAHLPAASRDVLLETGSAAYTLGLHAAGYISAAGAFVMAIAVLWRGRRLIGRERAES